MNSTKFNLILFGFIGALSCSTISLAGSVPQKESDAARISMLEQALAPDSPDALATLFATANKNRNAAVQFMLFSDNLKNKYKDNWPYWVSGTSSPWITSFSIKKSIKGENTSQFQITYQWATADGPFSPPLVQTIVVEPVPQGTSSSQKYWITRFSE